MPRNGSKVPSRSGKFRPATDRFALFGQRPLFPGEDTIAYDKLLTRVVAAVKPTDILEEIWVKDFVQPCLGGNSPAPSQGGLHDHKRIWQSSIHSQR